MIIRRKRQRGNDGEDMGGMGWSVVDWRGVENGNLVREREGSGSGFCWWETIKPGRRRAVCEERDSVAKTEVW